MDPARWKSIESLFNAAWDVPPSERSKRLDAAASASDVSPDIVEEVRLLLEAAEDDRSDPTIGSADALEAIRAAADTEEPALQTGDPKPHGPAEAPMWIGEWRIESRVGSGSMAVVYRAWQDRPRRVVALKLLRTGSAGPGALRRFELEADLLARLDHPAIARVHSAGCVVLDGEPRPYVAMEFVEGPALDVHVRSRLLGRDAILSLLADIADGVDHAHRRGVLHRDLKPSNILVGEEAGTARPRILDFGVARLLDREDQRRLDGALAAPPGEPSVEHTRPGVLVGTLSYLPPEAFEAEGDPDTGRDIYALGVIAYELLAGRLPFGASGRSLAELMRSVREDSAVPLGAIRSDCRGDVERLVAKAMARERSERYDSAAALAADLRRVLAGEPILARQPTLAEEWRRIWRRRRPALLGLAIAAVGLVFGTALAIHGLVAATDERDRARAAEAEAIEARDESEAVQAFLVETLGQADPTRSGARTTSVHAAVDLARSKVGERFAGRPRVAAAVHLAIGRVALSMGALDVAESEFTDAVALAEAADGPDAPLALAAGLGRAVVLRERGELPASSRLLDACVQTCERLAPPRPAPTLADALFERGVTLQRLGELDRARTDHERALALRRRVAGDRSVEVADSLDALGIALRQSGLLALAEERQREALSIRRLVEPPGHPLIGDSLHNLSRTVQTLGRPEEALALVEESLAIQRAAYQPPHPSIALVLRSVAITLASLGRVEDADARHAESAAMFEALHPEGHANLATALVKRAELAFQMDRQADAEAWIARARAMLDAIHGATDRSAVRLALIQMHLRRGEIDVADGLVAEELDESLARFGERHLSTATALTYVADVAWRRRALDDAARAIDRALAIERALLGDDHPRTTQSMHNRGFMARAAGDFEAAAGFYDDSARLREARSGPGDATAIESRIAQGWAELDAGRPVEALSRLNRCTALLLDTSGDTATRQLCDCAVLIDRILGDLGRHDEALLVLGEAMERADRTFGPADRRGAAVRAAHAARRGRIEGGGEGE